MSGNNTNNSMNEIVSGMLEKVAGITDVPTEGAFNIRLDGKSIGRDSTDNIKITPKTDKSGIDIHVKAGTKGEVVHIPVVIDESGLNDLVYNDFYIGEDSDVLIIAGCGIHNCGDNDSQHDGIHSFYLEKNARVRYEEKHYGESNGSGENILNPVTNVYLKEGAVLEMDTVQIEGVDSTKRVTNGELGDHSTLTVSEKLMTGGKQWATTEFNVELNGEGCSTDVASRSVAKDDSVQEFISTINGNNDCHGHSECDAIIMGNSKVTATPVVTANHVDAELIHEAAIGKIAGEQITKLMTLGLSQEDAEHEIVNGFLR